MSLLVVALIAVLLTAVVAVISAPLRARPALDDDGPGDGPDHGGSRRASDGGVRREGPGGRDDDRTGAEQRSELEANREAKYREIRDAELDFRTGKLSEPDYRALDAGLRADAAEILRELDRVGRR